MKKLTLILIIFIFISLIFSGCMPEFIVKNEKYEEGNPPYHVKLVHSYKYNANYFYLLSNDVYFDKSDDSIKKISFNAFYYQPLDNTEEEMYSFLLRIYSKIDFSNELATAFLIIKAENLKLNVLIDKDFVITNKTDDTKLYDTKMFFPVEEEKFKKVADSVDHELKFKLIIFSKNSITIDGKLSLKNLKNINLFYYNYIKNAN